MLQRQQGGWSGAAAANSFDASAGFGFDLRAACFAGSPTYFFVLV